ncbi:hypothetical protein B5S28_g3499 [[Candida] boidinii]|nr:hypothetical protein B5S28_g3499 [[Candida] boidinii]OWB59156.1 hypothetical protein B5S29_g10 [[Candida] boidinii]OWB70463.1 hypothetical protein B5S31_g141 [[Candida] boidinii]OWB75875.1 hypothetical protein B5S32_g22 [[Candida] boidinii]
MRVFSHHSLNTIIFTFSILFSNLVLSHGDHHNEPSRHNKETPYDPISLPDLISVSKLDDLKNSFTFSGDSILENGRIILTPSSKLSQDDTNSDSQLQKSSMWLTNDILPKSLNDFSFEITMRSLGNYGKFTNAGISFWLLDSKFNSNNNNLQNFNGPQIFKGLQILIDTNTASDYSSVKFYLNDGTKPIDLNQDAIGIYALNYQDSQVPLTLKFGYKINEKWLKLTIDNKLLFESTDIDLSSLLNNENLKIGITCQTDKSKHEQFEILRLKGYNYIVESLNSDQIESLFSLHAQESLDDLKKARNGDSISNNNKENHESSTLNFLDKQNELKDNLNNNKLINDLNLKLDNLQNEISNSLNSLSMAAATLNGGNNNIQANKQLFDLSKSIKNLNENLGNYHSQFAKNYENLKSQNEILNRKYDLLIDSLNSQSKLIERFDERFLYFSQMFDKQFKNNEFLNDNLNKLNDKYSSSSNNNNNNLADSAIEEFEIFIKSVSYYIKIVLIPILIVLLLLAGLVYRLRSDIKHSKVL